MSAETHLLQWQMPAPMVMFCEILFMSTNHRTRTCDKMGIARLDDNWTGSQPEVLQRSTLRWAVVEVIPGLMGVLRVTWPGSILSSLA